MNENWCAFCISIVKNVTPEQAFLLLDNWNIKSNKTISDEDIQDMINMKKTMSFREIGECYNISECSVYRRIKTYLSHKAVVNQ